MRHAFAAPGFHLREAVAIGERIAGPAPGAAGFHGCELKQARMQGEHMVIFHVVLVDQLPVGLHFKVELAGPSDGGEIEPSQFIQNGLHPAFKRVSRTGDIDKEATVKFHEPQWEQIQLFTAALFEHVSPVRALKVRPRAQLAIKPVGPVVIGTGEGGLPARLAYELHTSVTADILKGADFSIAAAHKHHRQSADFDGFHVAGLRNLGAGPGEHPVPPENALLFQREPIFGPVGGIWQAGGFFNGQKCLLESFGTQNRSGSFHGIQSARLCIHGRFPKHSVLHFYEKNDVIIFMNVKMKKNKETKDQVQQLGDELRGLRKAHGLTLQDLAEKSGKSVSFISKIERGLARPSITALQDIAEAMGVPIGWFFQTDGPVPADERPYIVRKDRRRRLTYSGVASTDYMGFEDYLLSAGLEGDLAMGMSHYAPGGTSGDDLYTHKGEEAGLVVEGEIELALDDESFLLKTGDSFSFPASIPHTYRNPGKVTAKIVWANTPVTLRR